MMDLSSIRRDYRKKTLDEQEVHHNPIEQFKVWFEEVLTSQAVDATAFTLATMDERQRPQGRIVLLKEVLDQGFVFFTNYNSAKGQQIAKHPIGSMIFYWPELERQVRITGKIEKIAPEESRKYFKSRPVDSQISGICSPQSQEVPNRQYLEDAIENFKNSHNENEIEWPENWGGYIIIPDEVEFWQGRASRLHDRVHYQLEDGKWKIARLAP